MGTLPTSLIISLATAPLILSSALGKVSLLRARDNVLSNIGKCSRIGSPPEKLKK